MIKTHCSVINRSLGFEFQGQCLLNYVHGQTALLHFLLSQVPSLKTEYNHNSILNLYICEESKW